MAIEVIKPGVLPGHKPCTGTCTNCGCEIKCTLSDTKSHDNGRDFPLLSVECPTCEDKIWVTEIE